MGEPPGEDKVIFEYRINESRKVDRQPADLSRCDPSLIWLDACDPDDGELTQLSGVMGFEVPNRHDMTEIELSSRLYFEDDAYVMIASLLPKSETEVLPPRPAAFILNEHLLLTIRFTDFYSFDRVAGIVPKSKRHLSAIAIFCELLDEAVSDRADNLEYSMRHMEALTSKLFHTAIIDKNKSEPESPELDEALLLIGAMGERVSNIRESIASLQRVLNFAQTYLPEGWIKDRKTIMRSLKADLTALSDEASFFMNKLSFNLDATLGMINIEESKIIRLLSVVTLLLMPPTLIAGIYGMNFKLMPELHWPMGYGFALGLMAMTSIISIWYLKRRRWL